MRWDYKTRRENKWYGRLCSCVLVAVTGRTNALLLFRSISFIYSVVVTIVFTITTSNAVAENKELQKTEQSYFYYCFDIWDRIGSAIPVPSPYYPLLLGEQKVRRVTVWSYLNPKLAHGDKNHLITTTVLELDTNGRITFYQKEFGSKMSSVVAEYYEYITDGLGKVLKRNTYSYRRGNPMSDADTSLIEQREYYYTDNVVAASTTDRISFSSPDITYTHSSNKLEAIFFTYKEKKKKFSINQSSRIEIVSTASRYFFGLFTGVYTVDFYYAYNKLGLLTCLCNSGNAWEEGGWKEEVSWENAPVDYHYIYNNYNQLIQENLVQTSSSPDQNNCICEDLSNDLASSILYKLEYSDHNLPIRRISQMSQNNDEYIYEFYK